MVTITPSLEIEMSLIDGKQVTKYKPDYKCPFCGQEVVKDSPTCASEECIKEWTYCICQPCDECQSVPCICADLNKPMAPVEIQEDVDKNWRQFRDKANQDNFLRMAIKDLSQQIKERAKERRLAALGMAEAMILGGIHPNQRRFMD